MKVSEEDLNRIREKQASLIRRAEREEKKQNYQKAADLFGEAADAATGKECVLLAQRQMKNFFRANPADRRTRPSDLRMCKAA